MIWKQLAMNIELRWKKPSLYSTTSLSYFLQIKLHMETPTLSDCYKVQLKTSFKV